MCPKNTASTMYEVLCEQLFLLSYSTGIQQGLLYDAERDLLAIAKFLVDSRCRGDVHNV